jgi:ribonucleoside-diphosphate reductase alpha chain
MVSEERTSGESGKGGKGGKSGKSGEGETMETTKTKKTMPAKTTGLTIPRHFTSPDVDPFDTVEWEIRSATIANEKGESVFEQNDVEIPKSWSQLATNVVVSKYFRGHVGTPGREYSVRQLIGRVVGRIREWGEEGGYFATEEDARAYADELTYLLVHQKMAFNSPVWFNLGVENTKQQASACFINSVEDTMESIMDLAKTEAMLFKGGSGAGSNLSTIRSSREQLAGGGVASGPVSFMRGFDSFAGVIKSGGKTRRAAKMVILNVDHPDVMDFIGCKASEEKKAWSLIEEGYDGGFNVPGGAYDSVFFQNANHSIRVTDEFMGAAGIGGTWETKAVTSGEVVDTMRADEVLKEMADAAHLCGDPGIQYDSTINRWNPVKNSGRINSSNPCSEYMFLDDTACNLASLNLMTFRNDAGDFEVEDYRKAAGLTILGQEILVDFADYPTPQIEENSHLYRPLGLGYANLGALLMANGLPYDSVQGRNLSAALTSLMCGEAYRMSAEIAAAMGPFSRFEENREPFLDVIEMHRDAAYATPPSGVPVDLMKASRHAWDNAYELGAEHGYKNGQVTVLAPTGTIAFMMDCDTTGVEPDIALVKYKKLVGGGFLKIVNNTVPMALAKLGYSDSEAEMIIAHVDERETIEGAPGLKEEHLPVFDCAFRAQNGVRSIDWMGHIRMMGAVQPFLSGAISKTVNLPEDATVENIMEAYTQGWKLGLKALAVYRDGSKRTQPLNAGLDQNAGAGKSGGADNTDSTGNLVELDQYRPRRRKLDDEREAFTHKFSIGGHEGYLTTGLYDDGQPGEIFLKMAKEGSTVSGLMDTIATMTSIALQYGVPLKALVDKFSHTRFEPSGFTGNKQIPIAKSITDYVFRYLGNRYLESEETTPVEVSDETGTATPLLSLPVQNEGVGPDAASATPPQAAGAIAGGSGDATTSASAASVNLVGSFVNQADAPSCMDCGSIMVRNGACYKCPNCGSTSGCS